MPFSGGNEDVLELWKSLRSILLYYSVVWMDPVNFAHRAFHSLSIVEGNGPQYVILRTVGRRLDVMKNMEWVLHFFNGAKHYFTLGDAVRLVGIT